MSSTRDLYVSIFVSSFKTVTTDFQFTLFYQYTFIEVLTHFSHTHVTFFFSVIKTDFLKIYWVPF